ncbi:MAG: hypothetical protein QME71_08755 [Dehalococcoidia bacterium]|nr:hypothetical protein [Dehalococcoidia bacterium]
MLEAISVEYYYKAHVEELNREAERIYRARQAETNEKPRELNPSIQRANLPVSGLRPKSACR